MEDPVKDISGVIHILTQSPPSLQQATINKYFTPNASFNHPFCRTGSWPNSRRAISVIYRWYKILSPRIEITVQGVAFDEPNLTLYVQIFQIFRIWFIPLYYAPVHLTTVLGLQHNRGDGKYYIKSQDDLYQTEEWIKFILPGGWIIVLAWQFWATFFCWLGALVLAPVTWMEEQPGWKQVESESDLRRKEWEDLDGVNADEVLRRSQLRGKLIG